MVTSEPPGKGWLRGVNGGVVTVDGSYYHVPTHALELLVQARDAAERERDEARAEAAQWQESSGQNYVRATEAERREEALRRVLESLHRWAAHGLSLGVEDGKLEHVERETRAALGAR